MSIPSPLNAPTSRTIGGFLVCAAVVLACPARADAPALLHKAPAQATPGEALEVEGTLVGTARIDKVLIRYRGPGDQYSEAEMQLQYGDLYRGYIPASRMMPPGIEYYVVGITRAGDEVPLYLRRAKPARVSVSGPAPKSTERRVVVTDVPTDPVREAPTPKAPQPSDTAAALEDDLALYSAVDTVALATRQDEKVQRVPAIATSIDRKQIQALGARTVYDVLDMVPGLTISRDVQGFYRTAVRGLRSDPELLFLLNGHPLNNAYDGRALANLPAENVERIEVIRGPGSALYGAGAFLGVVNVVTTMDEEGVRGAATGGSFGVVDGHLSGTRKFGGLSVSADADVLRQDGYRKPVLRDSLAAETAAQSLRTELEPSGYTHDDRFILNLGASAKLETDGAGQVGLAVRYMNERRAALIGLFDTVGPNSELGWQVLMADLTWKKTLGEKTTLQARAFFDDQRTDRLFQLTPQGFRDGGFLFDTGLLERTRLGTRSFGVDAGADIQLLEGNRLSVGAVAQQASLVDYRYETNFLLDESGSITEYLGDDFRRPSAGFEYPQELGNGAAASRVMLSVYAQDQWSIVEQLSLTFGFRVDATELPVVNPEGELVGTSFVPSFNPRAGVVWAVSEPLVLKLLYGRAFRSPTIQELAEFIPETEFNQGRFEGNPDLDPATVDTVELGADLVRPAGDARVRLRGNLFYESFSNPIAAVDDTGNVVPLRNRTEGLRVFGAETEARLEVSERANTWVNASWFRAQDLESELGLLTDTPQLRLNAGMSMPIGKWLNFDLNVRIGVERRNNSRSVLEYMRRYRLPTYTLVGAQLRTEPLFGHVQVALSGQNLLDVDYADDAPRPDRMPGMVPREGLAGFITVRVND